MFSPSECFPRWRVEPGTKLEFNATVVLYDMPNMRGSMICASKCQLYDWCRSVYVHMTVHPTCYLTDTVLSEVLDQVTGGHTDWYYLEPFCAGNY